jgi:hypothetical protein
MINHFSFLDFLPSGYFSCCLDSPPPEGRNQKILTPYSPHLLLSPKRRKILALPTACSAISLALRNFYSSPYL